MMEMFGQPCRQGQNHNMREEMAKVMPGFTPSYYTDQHYVFDFDNGWGASVIHSAAFGWELAVINKDGHIDYQHPVSQGDVVRGSEADIASWLTQIKETT